MDKIITFADVPKQVDCPYCQDIAEVNEGLGLFTRKLVIHSKLYTYQNIHGIYYKCLKCGCAFETDYTYEAIRRKYNQQQDYSFSWAPHDENAPDGAFSKLLEINGYKHYFYNRKPAWKDM
jgi:DNA-directed RNA polymerase subunit RPC12/RpoP